MQQPLVPYVRRPDWPDHPELVVALRHALPELDIVEIDALTPDHRSGVRVAIVDGPLREQLTTLPDLEWVQSTWAGVDAVIDAVPEHIEIARMIDPELTRTMSEAVLAWTLYLHRDMPAYAAQASRREWRELPLVRAGDRGVAILGLGALGADAARTLTAHGVPVVGWSRTPKAIDGVVSHAGLDRLPAVLAQADIVVNLLPDTPATTGLLGAEALAHLPVGARLINFGRGTTVDDDALLAALDSGAISHAVLDVFTVEPLPDDHPYWTHRSVTVLPHISGPTSPDTAAEIVAANIRAFLADGRLPDDALVDRERGY